jgi:purine-binding chemotaxis protein CheW
MIPTSPVTLQYATFRIQDLTLGIEVTRVQEVIRYQPMTVVPLAPSVVEGLINLRGQIVIAIDTRRSLGLTRAVGDALPMNIVIQSGDGLVSLLVDEIGDVIDVPAEAYAPVPDNMPQQQRELINCVYDLPAGLMLVLDTARVLENACH